MIRSSQGLFIKDLSNCLDQKSLSLSLSLIQREGCCRPLFGLSWHKESTRVALAYRWRCDLISGALGVRVECAVVGGEGCFLGDSVARWTVRKGGGGIAWGRFVASWARAVLVSCVFSTPT
jgi:hypothetical protein